MNKTYLIRKGLPAKIFFLIYSTPMTKYEIMKAVNATEPDIYGKKGGRAFFELEKEKYVESHGINEKNTVLYRASCTALIDEIVNLLQKQKQSLTDFEKWVLHTILDSDFTRSLLKDLFFSIDFNYEIDAYHEIIEKRLIFFIISVYIVKNIWFNPKDKIFEPNEKKEVFNETWKGKKQVFTEKEKILADSFSSLSKSYISDFSKASMPTNIAILYKSLSKIPTDTDIIMRWASIPNSLLTKLILISSDAQLFLSMFLDCIVVIGPQFMIGYVYPDYFENPILKEFIKDSKKSAKIVIKQIRSTRRNYG